MCFSVRPEEARWVRTSICTCPSCVPCPARSNSAKPASPWDRHHRPGIDAPLDALGVGNETVVVEQGEVPQAKPEPDELIRADALRVRRDPADLYLSLGELFLQL